MMVEAILASVLAGAAVLFTILGLAHLRRRDERWQQLLDAYQDALRARDLELQQPFRERVLRPALRTLIQAASRLTPTTNLGRVQQRLLMAGEPWGLSALDFMGLRILSAGLGLLATLWLVFTLQIPWSNALLLGAGGLLLGYIYPNMWLNRRSRARQKAIRRALPDAIDMLTIAVNAGLGFDAALARVADKWSNPLTEEFQRTLYELHMGVPRAEALRHLAERTGVEELGSFVAVVIQAERLGASISDVLQAQARTLRQRRRQWAEEQARKAPIKMLIPLVLFIFPSLFIVILGPAVPRIMAAFSR